MTINVLFIFEDFNVITFTYNRRINRDSDFVGSFLKPRYFETKSQNLMWFGQSLSLIYWLLADRKSFDFNELDYTGSKRSAYRKVKFVSSLN